MKFFLEDHQGKGRPYAEALIDAGWTRAESYGDPGVDVGLFDHDIGDASGKTTRAGALFLHERGAAVMIYPHAARPMLQWDGMYPVWPHTRLNLLIAEGHREVMEVYGYPLPMAVSGWALCKLSAFGCQRSAREEGQLIKVLFGPIHPTRNGFLHPIDRAINTMVYHKLLDTPGIKLTVRHVMSLERNGLWGEPGVNYVLGNPNGSTDEIDQADVVVGHQTFAYLAAARGKPLIMFGDDIRSHSGNSMGNMKWAAHYEAYRELMRYPLEVESARNGTELRDLIERAMADDVGKQWRERFIGRQMDPCELVNLIERNLS